MKKSMPALVPILVGIVLFPIVLFAGFSFWKTNTYEDALAILARLTVPQKVEILDTCNALMATIESSKKMIEKSPFAFMSIDFIRLSHKTCEVFLYKGPGKGVGFVVKQQAEQNPGFYWFNDYESWDRHPVELQNLPSTLPK
ncbi:hypothetical protein [Flavobacterium sp. W21_SRS_FM6]|uniref:hypothetical protein n=1 Tax=Flavobacterium sp. W21_SRS_FM6 TaxID=3240268 RepID=UPI003F903789